MSEHPMPVNPHADLIAEARRLISEWNRCHNVTGHDAFRMISRLVDTLSVSPDAPALISEAREAGRLREYAAKIRALEKDLYRSSLLAGPPKYYERGPQHKAWIEGRYSTAKALRELRQNYQALSPPTPDATDGGSISGGLSPAHQDTFRMVRAFSAALADKLARAELKYGYTNGWLTDDWEDECRAHLREHMQKGDPLDVAAYAAFCWARGWSTATKPPTPDATDGETP